MRKRGLPETPVSLSIGVCLLRWNRTAERMAEDIVPAKQIYHTFKLETLKV
ncbi:MAG: hypothetical protein ABH867_01970 [Patescibacteria group bacterium]|nr:hypothetical protein [Patescibacteria group bacterium]